MIAPFVLMLLSIALLPLVAGHWYERNRNKAVVSAVLGVPVVLYIATATGGAGRTQLFSTAHEYFSFIVLLTTLYTIAGGIYLTGNLVARPTTNLAFLLSGAVIANLIGTTGAAMVLIRPLVRANSERANSRHVIIFFIFVVCNVGGLLTPLGDPPLFLGFLRGVDFFWTLRLLPQWALALGLTLAIFMVLEVVRYRKEPAAALEMDKADYVPMRLVGGLNIVFLVGAIAAVLLSQPLGDAGETLHFPFLREVVLIAMMLLSLRFGPSGPRRSNHFSWAPMTEVALVFAGIFAAMIPALALLEAHGGELGLTQPWHYFWASGVLSSFLDNAPTYLTFTSAAQGYLGVPNTAGLMSSAVMPSIGWSPAAFLAAVSAGSVFMGANSYIGNAPNFMVRSVSEHLGLKMPSFFGYMAYSGLVLLPVFAVVTLVFFR